MNPFHDPSEPAELTNKLEKLFQDKKFVRLDAWYIIRQYLREDPEISLHWILRLFYGLTRDVAIEKTFRRICVNILKNLLGVLDWEMTASNVNQLINPSSDWYQYERKDIMYICNTILTLLQSTSFQNLLFQHGIVPNSGPGLRYIEDLIKHVKFHKERCTQLKRQAEFLEKYLDICNEEMRRKLKEDPDKVTELIARNLERASHLGSSTTKYQLPSKNSEDQFTHLEKPNGKFMGQNGDKNGGK